MKSKAKKVSVGVHPLKLACGVCGAEPYTLCRGEGEFTDSVRWCHVEREREALFGGNE